MPKIAIVGTTSWGTTLGILLANKGLEVRLWARTKKEAKTLNQNGPNPAQFPGVTFPPQLSVTSQIGEAMDDVNAVILAVPSPTMRQNISQVESHLTKSTLVVSAAKGLEIGSNKRMSQVIAEEINPRFQSNICVLSGPNLAREILRNLPAATVAAAYDQATARKAQRLLTAPNLCIADGLGCGDNAKAAFMTRGLTEITALGMALGANPLTFSGLAGLGDVIATCTSPLSRNHYVGAELAKGRSLAEITDSMTEVAEGINTTLVAQNLAQQLGLEMPITEKIYQVLYEDVDPRQAAADLMGGNTKHELSGRKWRLFSLFRRSQHPSAT
jgi:glycerol-3-phosphate dehydrogenase (NAD(P)+)